MSDVPFRERERDGPDAAERLTAPPLTDRVLGDPNGAFVLAEWSEPGRPGGSPALVAPLHVHHDDDEAWYVLEGTLRFRLGDREVDAQAGSAVYAPRGTPHTYWNPGPDPARYVLVMTANTYRLIVELHSGSAKDPEAMRAAFRKCNCEIVEE